MDEEIIFYRKWDALALKQALIEAFETSGLSAPRFAALHGVNDQTMVSRLGARRLARFFGHGHSPGVLRRVDAPHAAVFPFTLDLWMLP